MSSTLALFDLDNTLLNGDSDHAWGDFLVRHALVDVAHYKSRNDAFYQDYLSGCLDMQAYLEFCLEVLAQHDADTLAQWHQRFMDECWPDMYLPKAQALLEQHRQMGHRLVIITATNRFVTEPIARRLGVADLIATDPEHLDGRYTGRVQGAPCFREGKIIRLQQWLTDNGLSAEGCWVYSDSHNDLPLLEYASHPHAVDPDPRLRAEAEQRGWPVLSLRQGGPE